jgi:hypothetical protein
VSHSTELFCIVVGHSAVMVQLVYAACLQARLMFSRGLCAGMRLGQAVTAGNKGFSRGAERARR